MPKVSKRGGFSDRNGIKPENTVIQLEDFDGRTRIKLQNMINNLYYKVFKNPHYSQSRIQDFFRYILGDIYSEVIDSKKTYYDGDIFELINNTIKYEDYDDVLTLIEGLVGYWDRYLKDTEEYDYYSATSGYTNGSIFDYVNHVFEKEYVGYRFINGLIMPISDEIEVSEINDALKNEYEPVRKHLSKACNCLSNREKPDYENTIKESISAVESICKIITGASGNTASLGKMLNKLKEQGVDIHPALESAFEKLYGFTSDKDGIRHGAGLGGPTSTFAEAKFMFVSCCAFINYLMEIRSRININ